MKCQFLLGAGLCFALAPAAANAGDAEAGRVVSETHCARCHVVGEFNPMGGISSTPSFQLLVERRPDYRNRFLTFFSRPPHPSFLTVTEFSEHASDAPSATAPVEITLEDVENIAAFVETLVGMSETGS